MSLVIENVGFASPLHQVSVYLLLIADRYSSPDHIALSRSVVMCSIPCSGFVYAELPVYPRFWRPEQSPFDLTFSLGVGSDVPEGSSSSYIIPGT